jgi:oligopeptide transport system ATP-binding protein
MTDPILSLRDVDISFGRGKGQVRAARGVSFEIGRGEAFALVGESGSGKTSVGRAILRIKELSGGEILFDGKRISGPVSQEIDRWVTRSIQMVFQDPLASLNERATVDYIVSEGLRAFGLFKDEAERRAKVARAMADVGLLPEHAERYPHEFSGGQRQRIGLARALVMEPELIVADEPVSALDVSVRSQVLNLLSEARERRGLSYLFISHDLSVVRYFADRVAVIYQGELQELASTEELFERPEHPYTQALLSAVPIPNPETERPRRHTGYVPLPQGALEWAEVRPGHFVRKPSAR